MRGTWPAPEPAQTDHLLMQRPYFRPDLLEGAWPWPEAESQCQQSQHPFSISYDAGQYVCESTYWARLDFRRQCGYPNYAAFIHVSPLSDVISAEMIAGVLNTGWQRQVSAPSDTIPGQPGLDNIASLAKNR